MEDVSERRQIEERLKSSLGAMIALHEAGRVLSSTLSLDEIGARLVKIVQRVATSSTAVISLVDEQGRLCVLRSHGPEGVWRLAHATLEAQAARSRALETKRLQQFRLEPLTGASSSLVGLCLPLVVRDRLTGILEVCGPEDLAEIPAVETLESISRQAASALENARLHRELAEREHLLEDLAGRLLEVREEERRRLACDIHDGLVQVAFAAHQKLQAYAEAYSPEPFSHREQLDRALQLVQQTVGEARRVITTLRPPALDGAGLGAMLKSQVSLLRREGWEIIYTEALRGERLPSEIETTLYWVTQEALTNIRKHARTTQVNITLRCSGRRICLEVRDWGCGFDRVAPQKSHRQGEQVGLSGMQERVALLDGEFRIHSQPGMGTSVVAEIPLDYAIPTSRGWIASSPSKTSPARLLVADDHALIREGFQAALAAERDLEVVGEATDGREAVELCRSLRPDLVLMDVRMPEMDGLAAARTIKDESTCTNILMITAYENPDCLFEAIQAGAAGYVTKDASRHELVSAVRGALSGKSSLNPELAMQLLRRLACVDEQPTKRFHGLGKQPDLLPEALTLRELEILALVAQGKTNRQIARELIVSPATVKVHVEHILAKLGVSDRTQAAVRASEAGLLDPMR